MRCVFVERISIRSNVTYLWEPMEHLHSDITRIAESSFSSALPLKLHILIYSQSRLTHPNCNVTIIRPSIYRVLQDLTSRSERTSKTKRSSSSSDTEHWEKHTDGAQEDAIEVVDADSEADIGPSVPFVVHAGGGLAVCASGPEGLIR